MQALVTCLMQLSGGLEAKTDEGLDRVTHSTEESLTVQRERCGRNLEVSGFGLRESDGPGGLSSDF